jgi:serine/threonine protein kinase
LYNADILPGLQLHQHRTAESCHLLTSDVFKLRHETSNGHPGCKSLPHSDIWIAQGNYVIRGQRVVSDFVLETKTRENDVRFLCAKLNKNALGDLQESLLSVIGYRQPPYSSKGFQVVVELPPDLERNSLSYLLSTRPPPELPERLAICKNLAVATKAVHSIELVHKAIRPRSILMLSKPGHPLAAAKAYLQDWNYVREVSGATTELGEADWPKRIYQHPERQGEYAEAAFETRHDLYSLGVCMLEVLLWRPFVVVERGGAAEALKVCGLFEQYGFAHAEKDSGLPERYRGDSVKMTSRPWITKTIWENIANAELANPDLAQLVLQCLQGNVKIARDVELHVERLIAA